MILHNLGPQWSGDVQAATTIVLVVATSIYAYFTYQTVQLIKDSPAVRLAAQVTGTNDLLSFLHESIPDCRKFLRLFPFKAVENGQDKLKDCITTFDKVLDKLRLAAPRLHPSIAHHCLTAASGAKRAKESALDIYIAMTKERVTSAGEKRAWSEIGASLAFERANETHTWAEAIKGRAFDDSIAGLEKLKAMCEKWLLFDEQPDIQSS